MFKTKITEMLAIEHPILMGGMQWLCRAEFVAAAANAGIMAFLTAETFPSAGALRDEIREVRRLTKRPFGVNISMLPEVIHEERTLDFARVAAEERVTAVETAGRDPSFLMPVFKEAGVRVLHKVPSLRFAKKAVSAGVDAVIMLGLECGGHAGMDGVPTLVIIPRAVDELGVPVIAAGGIADARGFAAALALGAEAVLMGTRFAATIESPMHENIKKRYVGVTELDTTIIMRSIRNPLRCYRNKATEAVLAMEGRNAPLAEILAIVGGRVGRAAYDSGDAEGAAFPCSLGASLIHELKPIHEVVDEIIEGAHRILDGLKGMESAGPSARTGGMAS
jgi:nitronate monooxygenase